MAEIKEKDVLVFAFGAIAGGLLLYYILPSRVTEEYVVDDHEKEDEKEDEKEVEKCPGFREIPVSLKAHLSSSINLEPHKIFRRDIPIPLNIISKAMQYPHNISRRHTSGSSTISSYINYRKT